MKPGILIASIDHFWSCFLILASELQPLSGWPPVQCSSRTVYFFINSLFLVHFLWPMRHKCCWCMVYLPTDYRSYIYTNSFGCDSGIPDLCTKFPFGKKCKCRLWIMSCLSCILHMFGCSISTSPGRKCDTFFSCSSHVRHPMTWNHRQRREGHPGGCLESRET